jgi:hypothetical protein
MKGSAAALEAGTAVTAVLLVQQALYISEG